MWTTILAATISAMAALAGAVVNNMLSTRRLSLEFDRKRRDTDRTEMMSLSSTLISESWNIRKQAMYVLRSRRDRVDSDLLITASNGVDSAVAKVRILASKYETVEYAAKLANDLKEIVRLLHESGTEDFKQTDIRILTLITAAAQLQEVNFIEKMRTECGIGQAEGTPEFNMERDLKNFLRSVFGEDKEAIDRVLDEIRSVQEKKKDYRFDL